MNPAVTVLTLSYNSPDILSAVDSVISQSYDNIQYIIADDCSAEFPEEEIRQRVKSGGIKEFLLIRNRSNIGASASSNNALRYATGEYIINLAGDDVFFDNRVVEDIAAEFVRTGAQYITGYRAVYDEQMKKLICVLPRRREIKWIRSLQPEKLFEKLAGSNFIFGCCTARRADTVREYGFYAEEYRNIDDYPMIMRALREGAKISFFDRLIVKYRSGGISSALNLNGDYTEEADRLFRTEILPFSRNPLRAEGKYLRWKRRSERRRIYQLRKLNARGAALLLLKLAHAVSNPEDFSAALGNRFSRRMIHDRRLNGYGDKNA